MSIQDESSIISALTGFSLDHVLNGLQLPSGQNLSNQLGISGIPSLNSKQIYNDKWDDSDVIGADEGEDWEDEVNRELENEELEEDNVVKSEVRSPDTFRRERRVKIVKRLVERPKTVYERFPAFEKGKILNFTELFMGRVGKKSRVGKRPLSVETINPRKKEVPKGYLKAVVGATKRQVENKRVEEEVAAGSVEDDLVKALNDLAESNVPTSLSLHDRSFDLVLLSNWEDQIIYEPDYNSNHYPITRKEMATAPINNALEEGTWTQSIIWDAKTPFRDFTQIEIDADDENSEERYSEVRPRKRTRLDISLPRDRFNLSNDHYYEVSKDGARHRVRQTFGQLVVQHAYPAQKLQLPYYKTRLSKQEARSFHRPALQFPANIELRFSKVRTAKKKKDKAGRKIGKGGDVAEGLRKTSDLTLKDTSNFVLWEISEEHPPIISDFGMGSVLVNYYRKKDDKDDFIPKAELGEPFVLEPGDESPFMKFGSVYAGQTIQALYNNLIRAPLFRHKSYSTDFLVVRSTSKGETKYHLREIKTLYIVGQTYPVTEVPGPHSRKITTTIKNRLQVIAFKLLRKSLGERLKISRLMKYFPDQNELQMRQRLKEFMEYHRRGPHQGFWRLKEFVTIPSDADMLKMVSPEQVVLSESMQVGQRHLQDAGYGGAAETAKDDDESNLSIEQQLAPWITTKNFLQATQAKAMLRLHGEGDPTGRGEAFSFVRVSMKDIFVRAGEDYEQKMAEADNRPKSAHRYNVAEQQNVYKSEIERIWKAQFDSLSRKDEPQLTVEDENRANAQRQQSQLRNKPKLEDLEYPPNAAMLSGPRTSVPPASPSYSRGSSLDRELSLGPEISQRVLRIRRFVEGEWETEIVRDPAVIRAYVRRRQTIEEESATADSLAPTGDEEKDKRAKKRLQEEIARMKKNQERRLHRKNAKITKEGGTPLQLNRPVKPDTTRHCGHCGQMGHMKTNRKCPRWAEFNSGAPPISITSAASPPGTSGGSLPAGGNALAPPNFGHGFAGGSVAVGPALSLQSSSGMPFPCPPSAFVPSPLATSPPVTAMELDDDLMQQQQNVGADSSAYTKPDVFADGDGEGEKRKKRRIVKRRAPISLTNPRRWNLPIAAGVLPVYDEALKLIKADAVRLKRERADVLARAAERVGGGEGKTGEEREALEEEVKALRKRAGILEIQSDINLPSVRWSAANGMADMGKPVYRHLVEQKWRKYGALDLLMERIYQMNVVPDVLPAVHPTIDVRVSFPERPPLSTYMRTRTRRKYKEVEPGEYLVPEQTRRRPRLYTSVFHAETRLYTLVLVDPDVPDAETRGFTTYLHWIQPNIALSASTSGIVDVTMPTRYVPPHPQQGTPYHRYCLILLPHVEAETKVRVGSLKSDDERRGFDLRAFCVEHGLDARAGGGIHMWREAWDETVSEIYRHTLKQAEPRYGLPRQRDRY